MDEIIVGDRVLISTTPPNPITVKNANGDDVPNYSGNMEPLILQRQILGFKDAEGNELSPPYGGRLAIVTNVNGDGSFNIIHPADSPQVASDNFPIECLTFVSHAPEPDPEPEIIAVPEVDEE